MIRLMEVAKGGDVYSMAFGSFQNGLAFGKFHLMAVNC
jgi:hypothetical protein